jgi:FemAB-related protein (PEP-CTERM system-associated)
MAVDMSQVTFSVCPSEHLAELEKDWWRLLKQQTSYAVGKDPRWVQALCQGLNHTPFVVTATSGGELVGVLPLILVKSAIFGRFLVSLPYVNSAGIIARDDFVASGLIDNAIRLAMIHGANYLELRHEQELKHAGLGESSTAKVHMRLALPATSEELMSQFKSKLRSQIRNGEKKGLTPHWGGKELLEDFYSVFSRNMRDLGTPVYGRGLFQNILAEFGDDAEFCVMRLGARNVAAGLLIHSNGVSEVPSASSLREFNQTNANMVLYWQLLTRAIERGQRTFDFGRCDKDGNHFKFKAQWGAQPQPAIWQYHVLRGRPKDMRPKSAKYQLMIRAWQKLPVQLANAIGPAIVRGIP